MSNKMLKVLALFLLIILIVISSYRIYEYVILKDDNIKNLENKDNENEYNDELDKNIEVLDLNSNLIKGLKFPFTNMPNMLNSYYLKDKFEVESVDKNILNTLAFQTRKNNSGLLSVDGTNYILDGQDLIIAFQNLFGPEVSFKHSDFEFIPHCFTYGDKEAFHKALNEFSAKYDKENNVYTGIVLGNCGSQFPFYEFPVNEVFKAEKLDDEIYTYSYMFYYGIDDDFIYTEIEGLDGNEVFEKPYPCHVKSWLGDTIYDSKEELCEVNILSNLKQENKIPIYKATFRKQSDENYYFTKGEWQ